MASLEGGLGAIAFSSGLAAQLCMVLSLAEAGDHLVCTQNVYGGTVTQLNVTIKRMGIATTFAPVDDLEALRRAMRPQTKLLFVETIGNPSGLIADLSALARLAHDAGVPLVVDNTFATPYLCRPIERGADLVVHSATKFINGHGTSIGGVLIESGRFPWSSGRFPLLSQPSPGYHGKVFTETFGEYAFLMRARAEVLRDVGAQMSPMDAWLLLLGLETLELRMERHVRNARDVVAYLKTRPEVSWVREPQLGSIFTFGLHGGSRRGTSFHRCARALEPPRERRRFEEFGHPPGIDHPFAALRRRNAQGRRRARIGPPVGRPGGRRRLDLGSWERAPGRIARMILTTPSQRRDLLERIRTIAVVGASPNPLRPSYTVFSYLRRQPGYDVTPINPRIDAIDGIKAFPTLAAYGAAHGAPDAIDVFRKPSEVVAIVWDAIAAGVKAIWFQYGVIDDDAVALADAAGLDVVVDRCMKVEHARFCGGLSTSGANSGIITSRRRQL